MNLVRFLENRFQELNVENELYKDAFNAALDAEIKASNEILTTYRYVMKWIMIPKVLYDFICVNLGYKDEPKPVLLNRIKAQQDRAKEDKIRKDKIAAQTCESYQ